MRLLQKLTNEQLSFFYSRWRELKPALIDSITSKDSHQAGRLMQEGIQLYKELLAHCEHAIEPLNGQERLAFIEQNRGRYAAFRQLDELFEEMKKKIASKRIQLHRNLPAE
ncbi:YpoC family protein [Planococcus salinus]|uniref:YpoC-like domain-containing protein n=1 Tax=Planococcus salinus TaxID=1848460 RepID=A0A3M8PB97_9BACL|nr:hypothetical protein [Planococcus salinus]RNF40474.1 hypothetical protein EEX84_03360 [Planococcus salinus]